MEGKNPVIMTIINPRKVTEMGIQDSHHSSQPFPKRQISDPSKLKEFADDNLNLMKMAESYPNG